MAGKTRPRLVSAFSLGGEAAEADHLLEDAFYDSSDFAVLASKQDHRCFIVGRTGAGKSASLQRLEELNPEHVIRVSPEDLSLPYITNLQAIRYLDSLEVNLDTFWNTLWKHVLLVEIIRHRYNVDSPDAKESVLSNLKERFKNDRAKQAALAYLNEFEGRFWCEADERVREITDRFTERIEAEGSAKFALGGVGVNAGGKTGLEASTESRAQQVDRFQRIVNENQLARLNKMIQILDDHILESPHDFRYVVIDDLDKEWVDERIANDLIRCLFATVYGLQHVRNLKVLVALRTNIFQELDFRGRGGGQGEKYRALVLEMRWTKYDLEALLDERVKVAAKGSRFNPGSIASILPSANPTRGKPIDYLLDRTLMRPRDAIAFVNECLSVGRGKQRLTWPDIKTAERSYSINRASALRDEWDVTYPGIDQVIDKFRRSPPCMTRLEFQARLEEVMLLLSDQKFPGSRWLNEVSTNMWSAGPDSTWFEMYQPLARVLFNIGLVGVATSSSGAKVFSLDDPHWFEQESNVEQAKHFHVHPTFHVGLDMQVAARK